jgi:hypothetical protein
MADFKAVIKHLEARGYTVSSFESGTEAAAYLDQKIDGMTVGIGGSATIKDIGAYALLKTHNDVYWHWEQEADTARLNAMQTDIYLTSANALAETGEIVNIDGKGNRVSSTLFGHKKVYFVIGANKVTETYDKAVWRARNIASPARAHQMNAQTPCAVKIDRCYDCSSPGRICRGLVTLWAPMFGMEAEVILINEALGL